MTRVASWCSACLSKASCAREARSTQLLYTQGLGDSKSHDHSVKLVRRLPVHGQHRVQEGRWLVSVGAAVRAGRGGREEQQVTHACKMPKTQRLFEFVRVGAAVRAGGGGSGEGRAAEQQVAHVCENSIGCKSCRLVNGGRKRGGI